MNIKRSYENKEREKNLKLKVLSNAREVGWEWYQSIGRPLNTLCFPRFKKIFKGAL
jgi:hypothetical protein